MDKRNKNSKFNVGLDRVLSAMKDMVDSYIIPCVREVIREELGKEYFTSRDLKEKLGLSSSQLYKYRKQGLITYTQIGQKIIYPRKELYEFLQNHTNHKTDR